MPLNPCLNSITRSKVLLLGSGGLSIGQAGEFDYTGTQAVQAILDEGLEVILVNPNVATVQTDPQPRKKVYLYPIEARWVEEIIKMERPQAIVGGFGGQTALNCLIELEKTGVLKKYGVLNLGTSVDSLLLSEDRQKFADRMREIEIPIPPSQSATTVTAAVAAGQEIGFPVILRAAFTLGGLGGGFANSVAELKTMAADALAVSPQILIEKSLKGWREVEYEVMRDAEGNAICICNMENIDPLGIHTGDSIVVAPSQTLTDAEFQMLRNASMKIVESLKIVGECNVQFAVNPESSEYIVIEINARLSRSSALASKATGYPIAYIAAKVVMGYSLLELKSPVTGSTSAFFEPALDYVAVKVPRWDLNKFSGVSRLLSSTMKSVGEVMGLGRSFPEALQKAIRMVTETPEGLSASPRLSDVELRSILTHATDRRIFAIGQALRQKMPLSEVFALTKIDRWFLRHIQVIVEAEEQIQECATLPAASKEGPIEAVRLACSRFSADSLKRWKSLGFGDEQIAFLIFKKVVPNNEGLGQSILQDASLLVRQRRLEFNVRPVVKKIDTTAAEFPSTSNYLYLTYWGDVSDDLNSDLSKKSILLLGSGSYSIGTSVEFDWCAVTASKYLMDNNWRSVILNCNPETVSTDYRSSHRLYFEELSLERVLDIYAVEEPYGLIASMGGQVPNRMAESFARVGLRLIGHSAESIGLAEDRRRFSEILDDLEVEQPRWVEARSVSEVDAFVGKVGFPVLVRPSFVLSGSAMNVAYDQESLSFFIRLAKDVSGEHPIVISEFMTGAKEFEFDGVAQRGVLIQSIISEHVENAGVHSGDATLMVPTMSLTPDQKIKMQKIGAQVAKRLNLSGPFNIQLLLHSERLLVIECNARASRSLPFVSKVLGTNMAELATKAMVGEPMAPLPAVIANRVGVKSSVFSFPRLHGADPVMGVEMVSTGEVGAIATTYSQALLLSFQASSLRKPVRGILISAGRLDEKKIFLTVMPQVSALNIPIYATKGTAEFLHAEGYTVTSVPWPGESDFDCTHLIVDGKVDMVINIPKSVKRDERNHGRQVRETAVKVGCSLFTNLEKAMAFFKATEHFQDSDQEHQVIYL